MSLRHISRILLRAVQGPKDQNPRAVIKQGKSISESDKVRIGRVSSGMVEPAREVCVNEKSRMREVEKAETIMQLICWGPK